MELPEKILQNENTVAVFLSLLNNGEALGVRAVQKELGMSNPSTVYWHLQKLVDEGVVEKTKSNLYIITPEFRKVSKLRLPLSVTHYVVGKFIVPDILVQLVFLIINTLVVLGALLSSNFALAGLLGFLSMMVEIALLANFYRKSMRKHPRVS